MTLLPSLTRLGKAELRKCTDTKITMPQPVFVTTLN